MLVHYLSSKLRTMKSMANLPYETSLLDSDSYNFSMSARGRSLKCIETFLMISSVLTFLHIKNTRVHSGFRLVLAYFGRSRFCTQNLLYHITMKKRNHDFVTNEQISTQKLKTYRKISNLVTEESRLDTSSTSGTVLDICTKQILTFEWKTFTPAQYKFVKINSSISLQKLIYLRKFETFSYVLETKLSVYYFIRGKIAEY